MTKASVSIYACGGTGINIVKDFHLSSGGVYPVINKYYVDTSDANISKDDKSAYIIPGFENGSGSNRAEVYRNFDGRQSEYLNAFKPGSFNIVVFSLAGGTGNASGLLIMEEMLKRGIPVIAIAITETISKTRADSSYASFRSFMNFAEKGKLPFSAIFMELSSSSGDLKGEGNSGTQQYIVERARKLMTNICYITSEQHDDLDRRDVVTFINYHKVMDITPRLAEVAIVDPTSQNGGVLNQTAFSAVQVLASRHVTSNLNAFYIKTGHFKSTDEEAPNSVAMIITDSTIKVRMNRLKEKVDEFNKQLEAFKAPASVIEEGDERGFV